mgnify:CR=1 FL=1
MKSKACCPIYRSQAEIGASLEIVILRSAVGRRIISNHHVGKPVASLRVREAGQNDVQN